MRPQQLRQIPAEPQEIGTRAVTPITTPAGRETESPETDLKNRDAQAWTISDDAEAWPATLKVAGGSEDHVKDYLKQIGRYPLINAKEEVELAKKIEVGLFAEERIDAGIPQTRIELRELRQLVREGEAAMRTFLNSNLRLVVSIAKNYTGKSGTLDFLDLIQEGNLGLLRAVEKFDFTQGNKFSTYASWWIRQAITRAIGVQSRTIRIPIHVQEKLTQFSGLQRKAEAAGTDNSLATIALAAGFTEAEVEEWLRDHQVPLPLTSQIWAREGASLVPYQLEDVLIDENVDDIEQVELQELREQVHQKIADLAEREQHIIERRFGLIDGEPATLDAIGSELGVTRERIRQIEKKVLTSLQGDPEMQELAQELIGYEIS